MFEWPLSISDLDRLDHPEGSITRTGSINRTGSITRRSYGVTVTERTFTSSLLPPHDRGLEFGERFAAEIAETVATYRRLFERRAEGPFDVDLWSHRAWDAISRLAPVSADEIAGIAEGARLTVEQLASGHARTEILGAANPNGQSEHPGGGKPGPPHPTPPRGGPGGGSPPRGAPRGPPQSGGMGPPDARRLAGPE